MNVWKTVGFIFLFLLITDISFSTAQEVEIAMWPFRNDFPLSVLFKLHPLACFYQEANISIRSTFRLLADGPMSSSLAIGGRFLMPSPSGWGNSAEAS